MPRQTLTARPSAMLSLWSLASLALLLLGVSTTTAVAVPGGKIPAAVTEAYEQAEKHIYHLEEASFKTKLVNIDALVFYGATWCHFCQKLTPTWLELQKKVETELKGKNFKIFKVECTQNEELCENINGFPTIYHYRDGVHIGDEINERDLDPLFKFVKEHVRERTGQAAVAESNDAASAASAAAAVAVGSVPGKAGSIAPPSGGQADAMEDLRGLIDAELQPNKNVNPDGELVYLTSSTFPVMLHAPWCGHCKNLAPTWETLAAELKGRVNVGKVDCTVHTDICKKFNVKGYPTLIFLQEPDPLTEFKGPRELAGLKKFALDLVSKPSFTPIPADAISSVIEKEPVAFFFVYNPAATDFNVIRVFQSVAKTVKSTASVYISPSVQAFDKLSLKQLPSSGPVLVAVLRLRCSFTGDGASRTALRNWILAQRRPLVAQLDGSTQEEIFSSGKKVVLAVVDPAENAGLVAIQNLREAARSWKYDSQHSKAGDVTFAWLDGKQYSQHVFTIYGIKPLDLPRLIIADFANEEFYDTFANGEKFKSFGQATVSKAITEVLDGKSKVKSNHNFFVKTVRSINKGVIGTLTMILENLLVSAFVIFGSIAGLVWFFCLRPSPGYKYVDDHDGKAE
ncbi:thioredoxin-like protein [Entophlyctis helioformis]|nr:thioredoxin-like protein [Entophlyctis helioformis]